MGSASHIFSHVWMTGCFPSSSVEIFTLKNLRNDKIIIGIILLTIRIIGNLEQASTCPSIEYFYQNQTQLHVHDYVKLPKMATRCPLFVIQKKCTLIAVQDVDLNFSDEY